jgi:NAD(P)H-hydrate epimerase
MKIFKAEDVRKADAFTISHEPISSLDLMERAAKKIAKWILKKYNKNTAFAIIVGPGNNGGDGLVIARHLLKKDYKVDVFDVGISRNYSEDFLSNKTQLLKIKPDSIRFFDIASINLTEYDIIIDAILGSGLTRPIDGNLAEYIDLINQSGKTIISVDIPTGLFGEDNSKNNHHSIIKAQQTLSFQFPKLSFLLAENYEYVGKMKFFDIGIHPDFIKNHPTKYFLTQKEDVSSDFLDRAQFSHKGTYGHALLFAGSEGKMGAAILAAEACLRSGAGLVTALISTTADFIMQTALPEVMTYVYNEDDNHLDIPDLNNFTTLGIGPGIGQQHLSVEIFEQLLSQLKGPTVFDADALNLLSSNRDLLNKIPQGSIFTPHPKELERLIGKTDNQFQRLYKTLEMAEKHQIYMLIKGAYSVVVCPNGEFHFNSTGNPGMATAGSGDVLTGIITSLLAQGLTPFDALRTGVFIHGMAGDLAKKREGELSLIASDIIDSLGAAFTKLKDD